MKTRVTICTCLILLLSPAVVIAADGRYISGHIGASWLSDADLDGSVPGIRFSSEVEFDTGIHLGGAYGHDFGEFRVEGEFGYRSHEFEEVTDLEINGMPQGDRDADGDIDAFIFLANGFYDFDTETKWTPYVGGGIGFARLDIKDLFVAGLVRGDDDDTVFAYQVAGGIAYKISEQMVVDLSYRFLATSEPDFGDLEYNSHNLVAAIRFSLR
ncbi:MAG: outer membrane beta-barrel protein [Gammaproteobacteria bacterium]|nr:outer membrane beta-barrel protein [Gammaproteobacteria bacterium]